MRCILRDEPLSLDPHPYTPHPLSLPAAAALFSAVVARLARVEGGAVAWLAWREDGALRRLARAEVVAAARPPPGYSVRVVVSIRLQRRPRRRICPDEGVSGPGEGGSGPGGSTASIRPPVAPRRESTSGAPLPAAGGPVDGGSGEVELKASSHRIPAALGFR